MKVTVCLASFDGVLKVRIESFIGDNWPHVAVYSDNENLPERQGSDHDAILTVTNGRTVTPQPRTTLSETIMVNGDESVDEVLYLVNAKLGRLTNSDIACSDRGPSVESPLSRREFLFGMLGRSTPSANALGDAPIVSADSCEARFGCRKCVDTCPAPGALEIRENSLVVSKEHCIRCGLCAGICPVAAIQLPEMSDNAYRGLLGAIQKSPAPRKTLVITCCEEKVPKTSWIDVERVPGVGVIGVRQLAMAAGTSINATIVYCSDGLCAGKEHVKRAVDLISSITKASPPSVYYLEGAEGVAEIERIHNSAHKRKREVELPASPWKSYVTAIENISAEGAQSTGLGITDMQIAESCTLCYGCVDSCPHQALAIEQDRLDFTSEECTGCGFCAKICPERSITLSQMNGPIILSTRTVYKDEMIQCTRCKTPYVSAKMFKKVSGTIPSMENVISLCAKCRQIKIYEKLFGSFTPSNPQITTLRSSAQAVIKQDTG